MRLHTLLVGAAVLLIGMALIVSLASAPPIKYAQAQDSDEAARQNKAEQRHNESEGYWTIRDVAGLSTSVMVLFTGGLLALTWWINRQHRSDTRIFQRAYIAVDSAGVRRLKSVAGKAIASINIRNVGNLPARNVKWVIKHTFSDDKRLNDFPVSLNETEGENAMPPGFIMTQGSPMLSIKGEEIPSPRDRYLYIWGGVFYEDGFGNSRITRFCHRFNCINFKERELSEHFVRFHRYGNDAD